MEAMLALLAGVLATAAVWLLLSRNLLQVIFGLVLLSNVANLVIFTSGGLTLGAPPLIPSGLPMPAAEVANPLPQALIPTAIVIGFGLLTFALALAFRAYQGLGTADVDAMRIAEPTSVEADDDGTARVESTTGEDVRRAA
jgi:multicomponent Na+:H+ antiporter subunit C